MKSKKAKLIATAMAVVITAGSASVFANTTMSGKIGLERAKQIALEDAKVKATEASFVRAKLDKDDGYPIYDVEFYKGNVEYDYEIDAKTGAIREKDRDIEHYVIGGKKQAQVAKPAQPQAQPKANAKAAANKAITVEAAKEIALAHAGLKASQVQFVKAELDSDDGVKHYDIEFYANGKEYDYEIDFQSGKLLSVDYDLEHERKFENDDVYDDRDDRDDDRFEDDRYDDRDDLDDNRDDLDDRYDDRDDADDRYDDRDDDQDDREYDNDWDDDNDND